VIGNRRISIAFHELQTLFMRVGKDRFYKNYPGLFICKSDILMAIIVEVVAEMANFESPRDLQARLFATPRDVEYRRVSL
jgi:hypothetical protein